MNRLLRSALVCSRVSSACPRSAARALHLSSGRLAAAAAAATTAAATAAGAPPASNAAAPSTTAVAAGPYRRVGNIFFVHCIEHPFKFSWEVNRTLRELRLEFMGQTTIVPDTPQMRKRLWRVRHIVRVDHLDLDEAKALIGVPEHMSFRDLAAQLPSNFGRTRAVANPRLRSKMNFMELRRMRLRDVMHRDQLEKKLLAEKRRALQGSPAKSESA